MSDRLVVAFVAGIIGSILQTALSYILFLAGLAKTHYLLIAGEFLLNSSPLHTPLGYFVGFLADIIAGGVFAVIFVYILSITGKDYWLLKSIGFAGVLWLFSIGLIDRTFKLVPALYNDTSTNLALLASDLVYAVTVGFLVVKWANFPRQIVSRNYQNKGRNEE